MHFLDRLSSVTVGGIVFCIALLLLVAISHTSHGIRISSRKFILLLERSSKINLAELRQVVELLNDVILVI